MFAPHAGASYQITKKLVARGSWALNYLPLGINQWGGAPFAGEASFGYVGEDIMPAASSPVNAIYQWDSGSTYPGNPTAATRDPNANISCPWCAVSVDPNKLDLGHTNNWNLGAEYEITKNTVVDVSYVGNRGATCMMAKTIHATRQHGATTRHCCKETAAVPQVTPPARDSGSAANPMPLWRVSPTIRS